MMKQRNAQVISAPESQAAQVENFANNTNFNEVIRFRFLQLSAEYLRAGKESTPVWLDEKMKS